MALPVQDTPLYDVEIPSSGEKIKYRPFLIKEEKALLIAQQSNQSYCAKELYHVKKLRK